MLQQIIGHLSSQKLKKEQGEVTYSGAVNVAFFSMLAIFSTQKLPQKLLCELSW
jgi:hypothetical protein